MKKLILLFLCYGLWVAMAEAQNKSNETIIEQVTPSQLVTDEDLLERYSDLTGITNLQQQAADANQLSYIQMRGANNQALIMQSGSSNTGAINILGGFNKSTLHQRGRNLLSLIHIEGRSNRLEVNQNGNNLGNLVQVLGSGIDVDIIQNPAGFHYHQSGSANPITITSTARNVPVIIRNN
jgi:hypothetical protein